MGTKTFGSFEVKDGLVKLVGAAGPINPSSYPSLLDALKRGVKYPPGLKDALEYAVGRRGIQAIERANESLAAGGKPQAAKGPVGQAQSWSHWGLVAGMGIASAAAAANKIWEVRS